MKKGRSPSRARVGHRRGRDGAGPSHALYRVVRRLPDVFVVDTNRWYVMSLPPFISSMQKDRRAVGSPNV